MVNNVIVAINAEAYFFWLNDHKKIANKFVWFREWIMDRRVYRTLESEMDLSTRSISRLFKIYLSKAPQIAIHDIRYIQLYRTGTQEKFREIYQDLQSLKKLGVTV